MSIINSIEVYCNNQECGEPMASGGLNPVIVRSFRRMNYMGALKLDSAGKIITANVLGVALAGRGVMPGTYHKFQCPICGSMKGYLESSTGNLTQVS